MMPEDKHELEADEIQILLKKIQKIIKEAKKNDVKLDHSSILAIILIGNKIEEYKFLIETSKFLMALIKMGEIKALIKEGCQNPQDIDTDFVFEKIKNNEEEVYPICPVCGKNTNIELTNPDTYMCLTCFKTFDLKRFDR